MSSAQTENANDSATSPRRSGRDRTARIRFSQHSEPATPPNGEITFTVVFDNGEADHVHQIKLEEGQSYEELRRKVEEKFNIPSSNQLLFGWPGEEPKSNVALRELHLPPEVVIYLAEVIFSGVLDAPEGSNSQTEVISLMSSESPAASSGSESLLADMDIVISLHDAKNGETYDGIFFKGGQTVKHVKNIFTGITAIPVESQEWSGWPSNATDDCLLKDLLLDKPIHSLVLFELEMSAVDMPLEYQITSPHTCTASNSSIQEVIVNKPTSTRTPVASKRPSESALDEPTKRRAHGEAEPMEVSRNDESSSSRPERIVDDGQMPSTSKSQQIPSVSKPISEEPTSDEIQRESNTEAEAVPILERIVKWECEQESVPVVEEEIIAESELPLTPSKKLRSPRKNRESPFLKFLQVIDDKFAECKAASICLWNYLEPTSQLSLRRVCKASKAWISKNGGADNSRKDEEKWSRYQLEVTGIGALKCFESVVNMNLPITRYKFVVWGDYFYHRGDVESFIAFCGWKVKELTLTKFFMFQNTKERAIFESFTRLETLTIDELVVPASSTIVTCPSILANLQVLKLNYQIVSPEDNALIRPKCWDFTWGMLADCSSLMYFRFPRVVEAGTKPIANKDGIFTPLVDYISERERNGGVAIEYLDLKHFNNVESFYINRFVSLLRKCYSKDIKMKNVNALVIQQVLYEDGDASDTKYSFCENVISLVNYTPFVQNAAFHNLEKISLDVVPSVTKYAVLARRYKVIFWPKLTTIKIKDTVQHKTKQLCSCWQEVQEDLYGHSRSDVLDRGSVQYIKIDSPKHPYFLSEGRLAKRFYNLTRLEITSWCVSDSQQTLNKRLVPIWKKLKLEELKITNCPKLNDGSFTGEEEESEGGDDEDDGYAFHKLIPTLKKFTLGLDGVDGVTDISFIKVFSRMPLRMFIILSSQPTQVSEGALLKMEKRAFGRNVEYFPFHCWSSSKIDPGRFQRLGKKFRSLM